MKDVVLILTVIAFFAICVAFVAGCDRIIGPDDEHLAEANLPEDGDVPEGGETAEPEPVVS
jgi:hypothetical protein